MIANFSSKPTMHTFSIDHPARCCRAQQMKIIMRLWLLLKRRMNKIKKIMLPCNQLKSSQIIIEKQMLGMKIKKSWVSKRELQLLFKMIKRHLYQSVSSSLLTLGQYFLCRVRPHSPREEEVSLEVKL
jgi:hypothetical protein